METKPIKCSVQHQQQLTQSSFHLPKKQKKKKKTHLKISNSVVNRKIPNSQIDCFIVVMITLVVSAVPCDQLLALRRPLLLPSSQLQLQQSKISTVQDTIRPI